MSEEKRFRVLFVDDEARILDGLRRQYRPMMKRWEMRFVGSGMEAIEVLEREPIDVVVTDMKMPRMNGAELLGVVRQRWPGAIRFVLSGQTDQSELGKNIGAIHQFLQKPCEPKRLEHAIKQTHKLSQTLASGEIRALVGRLESLPVISSTYDELREVLNDETCSADAVGKIVVRDMGLSIKLLQMVNSAFFGLPRRVTSVKDAVVLIGISNIRQLITASEIFDALACDAADSEALAKLWYLGSDIGSLASETARSSGFDREVCDAARIAGTLSLVGRAVLMWGLAERHRAAMEASRSRGIPLHEAESEEFGASQQAIGAYALGVWAFDVAVVESVLYQVQPQEHYSPESNKVMMCLHAARAMFPESPLCETIPLQADLVAEHGVHVDLSDSERGAA